MYRVVIELKSGLEEVERRRLESEIVKAFDNYVGKLENTSTEKGKYLFESDEEKAFGILMSACLKLGKTEDYHSFEVWDFEDDEEPKENHSILHHYKSKMRLVV